MEIKNFEEVKAKLNQKLAPVECPMCHSRNGFTPYAQEFHQVSYNREGNILNVDNIDYVSVVLCRCNNCGFVAAFDLKKVLE